MIRWLPNGRASESVHSRVGDVDATSCRMNDPSTGRSSNRQDPAYRFGASRRALVRPANLECQGGTSAATADLVEMLKQHRRIVVDPYRAGALQLLRAVAPDRRPTPRPRQRRAASMSQIESPTITACSIGASSRSAAARNRSGSGLAYFTSSGHHRYASGVDAEGEKVVAGGLHPSARGDGPGNAVVGEGLEEFAGAGQRHHARREAAIGLCVKTTEPVDTIRVHVEAGLAEQLMGEEAAAHPDLAMNAPDRQRDALRVERFLPGEHVLVDAVDERAVEVEQEDGLDAHGGLRESLGTTGGPPRRCIRTAPSIRRVSPVVRFRSAYGSGMPSVSWPDRRSSTGGMGSNAEGRG